MKPDDRNLDAPIYYDPAYELLEPDEKEVEAGLIAALKEISETTFKHSGHAMRSVHAKSHGLLRGELEVLGGLPATLAHGVFARPGIYPLVMRLSTTPGDMLDDKVSTPRGMAIKLVGVSG
ncbi:catalase, partial [Herbaspirillum sp. 3C11]